MGSTIIPRTTIPGQQGTNIPSTPVTTPTPAGTPRKQQINDLISHIARSDNHLWQALNSLQNQTNNIVGNTTDWRAWDPKIAAWDPSNPSFPQGKPMDRIVELVGYYMTMGNVLFIEVYAQLLLFPLGFNFMVVDLPMNIGQTVIRTCAAYLTETADIGQTVTATNNWIIAVEAQARRVTLTLKPNASSVQLQGRFMMGGGLGIIQGS